MIYRSMSASFNPGDTRYADVRAQLILYSSPGAGLVVHETVEGILFESGREINTKEEGYGKRRTANRGHSEA